MKQETWRGEYRHLIAQMIGADPLIGRASIAERLAIPEDDLDQFLGVDWLDRAADCKREARSNETDVRPISEPARDTGNTAHVRRISEPAQDPVVRRRWRISDQTEDPVDNQIRRTFSAFQ